MSIYYETPMNVLSKSGGVVDELDDTKYDEVYIDICDDKMERYSLGEIQHGFWIR